MPDSLFVEAAKHGRPPGISYIKYRDATNRMVVLCLQFHRIDEFARVAQEITIQAFLTDDEENVIVMDQLTNPRLESLLKQEMNEERATIEVPLTFPDHGIWKIQWHAELYIADMEKPQVKTASTRRVTVNLTDPLLNRCIQEYPALLKLCRRQTGEIRAFCRKLQSHESNNPQTLEEESWRLHRLISKGRSMGRRLSTCLEILGYPAQNCRI